MGFLETFMVIASPWVVKYFTSAAKDLQTINLSAYRIIILRAIVAVLSLITALLAQTLGEGAFEPALVETAFYAVFAAGVATWLYFKEKED